MAAKKKFDPFKPAQPSIPGVPAAAAAKREPEPEFEPPVSEHPPASASRGSIPSAVWVLLGLIVVVGFGVWMFSSSSKSNSTSQADNSAAATAAPVDAESQPERLPIAPGIIGATKDIEKPWASKRFLFRSDVSTHLVPALVVHLPDGQYWAVSMIEPFGTCRLEYVTDLNELRTEYNFAANHPMIGDPCTHAVYDLLQYDGGAPNGGLVRGAIVHGAGVRPPLAIE